MNKRIYGCRLTALAVVSFLGLFLGTVQAEKKPIPPYLMTDANFVLVGVVFDESVKALVPKGIQVTEGLTGGINIYQTGPGWGIAPYNSAYVWVDVEGYDTPDGGKGRWMIQGMYGPDPGVAEALSTHIGFPVRTGTSRHVTNGDTKHAYGTLNGKDVLHTAIKTSDECEPVAGLAMYPTTVPGRGIIASRIPYSGMICGAEPLLAEITAPAGDPLSKIKIVKAIWAAELKGASIAFVTP